MPKGTAADPPLLRRLWPRSAQLGPATCRADAQAGLLGALLVLPQAIAFAALAGQPPAMRLAAAALSCAVAALGGSSRRVVSRPTNATPLALGAMLVPLAAGDASLVLPLALARTLMVGLMCAAGRVSPRQAWQQGLAPAALAVGGVALAAAVAGRRWWRRGPFLRVALLLGIGSGWWLTQQPLPGP